MKEKVYRELPIRDDHNCFGCGPSNPSGLQLKFYTDDELLYTTVTVPEHLGGWGRLVHGGVITTILDEIMGWSVLCLLRRLSLTRSITVDFLKPVHIGREMKAQGGVARRVSERSALMEASLFNAEGDLCARAEGTFALFTPDAIRKLGLMDEETLRGLERFQLGE